MSLHQKYSDDVRETATSLPLSEEDDAKLSRDAIGVVLEQVRERLTLSDEEFTHLEQHVEAGAALPEYPEYPVDIALEDFVPVVSTEDFTQRIRYILDKFLDWVKRVFRWFRESNALLAVNIGTSRLAVDQLEYDLLSMPRTVMGDMMINGDVSTFSLRYRPVRDAGELIGALKALDNHLAVYYAYADGLLKTDARKMLTAIAGAKVKGDIIQAVVPYSPKVLLKANTSVSFVKADDISYGYVSVPLLNNIRLLITAPDDVSQLSSINSIGCKVARAMTSPSRQEGGMRLRRFDRQKAINMQKELSSIVGTIETYFAPAKLQLQSRMVNDIESAITEMKRTASTSDAVNVGDRIAVARTLIEWVTQPYRSLATNTLRVEKATRRLCYRNMRKA